VIYAELVAEPGGRSGGLN